MTDIRTQATYMVAEDLYRLPDDDRRYELVNGELRVSEPPGTWHGTLASRIIVRDDDSLDGADVVPGFRLPLAELFAPMPHARGPHS